MRVTCNTVEEFIECVAAEVELFQDTIRVSISKTPITEASEKVTLQASAVIIVDGNSQYLLDVGVVCGVDYNDSTGESEGTDRSYELKQMLRECAENRNCKILPGIIGF